MSLLQTIGQNHAECMRSNVSQLILKSVALLCDHNWYNLSWHKRRLQVTSCGSVTWTP